MPCPCRARALILLTLVHGPVVLSAQEVPAVEGMSENRRLECKEVAVRIGREAMKGSEAVFSSVDLTMNEVCSRAWAVGAVQDLVDSLEATRGIRQGLLNQVLEAGNRLMRSFNERGQDAIFPRDDIEFLQTFLVAIAAVDCLAASKDTVRTAGVSLEILSSCVDAAARVLTEFNQRGKDARFNWSDQQALKRMQEALHER